MIKFKFLAFFKDTLHKEYQCYKIRYNYQSRFSFHKLLESQTSQPKSSSKSIHTPKPKSQTQPLNILNANLINNIYLIDSILLRDNSQYNIRQEMCDTSNK